MEHNVNEPCDKGKALKGKPGVLHIQLLGWTLKARLATVHMNWMMGQKEVKRAASRASNIQSPLTGVEHLTKSLGKSRSVPKGRVSSHRGFCTWGMQDRTFCSF